MKEILAKTRELRNLANLAECSSLTRILIAVSLSMKNDEPQIPNKPFLLLFGQITGYEVSTSPPWLRTVV